MEINMTNAIARKLTENTFQRINTLTLKNIRIVLLLPVEWLHLEEVVVNLLRQGFSCPNERSFPVLFASAKYWSSRPSFKTSIHIGPWSWQILFSIQVVVKVNCLTVYCESSSAHFCGVRFVTWNLLSCWWWIWKQFNSLLVDSWTFEARLLRPSWDKLSVQVKKLAWTPTCLLSPYHFSNESKTKQNDMQKLK
jgi:hypothetical protein